MIEKFEETGDLGMMRGRKRKWISNKIVEGMALLLSKESPVPSIPL